MAMQKKARRSGPSAVAVFFTVFFVLAVLVILLFVGDFFHVQKAEKTTYNIGDKSYTLAAELAVRGGERMICFDDIAELCEMSESGDGDSRSYFADGSEESVRFTDGSPIAFVNHTAVTMAEAAYFSGNKAYVPLSFVTSYVVGIRAEEEKNTVTVMRDEYNASTKDNPLYLENEFAVKGEQTASTAPEVTTPQNQPPKYTFVTDLSAYEPYMCPEDSDAYLILVNRTSTIDSDYVPENLVDVKDSRSDRTERMVETAEKALEALYIEMRAAGYTDVSVTSGYRSYDRQDYLYRMYTENEMKNGLSQEEAQKIVDTYSAKAGTSEHQTGLCCDMHNLPSADRRFAQKEAYTWLLENCYKFGFILRFPEGKEDITGYGFEPWHFRFVGRYHAAKIHELGMCLEEYIDYLGMQ